MKVLTKSFICFSAIFIPQIVNADAVNVGGGDVCSSVSQDMRTKAEEITKKYQTKITQRTTEIQAESQKIKDDSPKPDAAEAAVNFEIVTTSHDQEFFLDLPEITIKDQKMSMDLPQLTMRRKDMSFDNPTVVMRQSCIPGPPEVVCENGGYKDDFGIWYPTLDCKTREGKQMCADVPQVEMRKVDWSMDVPETTIARSEWVMGVPEFKMTTQRIVITLPDFTVKNVRVEANKAADAGNELSNRANGEMTALSKSLKEEISANAARGISNSFSCQRTAFNNKIADALGSIDTNITVVGHALDDARSHNANDLANGLAQSQQQLILARQNTIAMRDTQIQKMIEAEKNALAKAVKSDLQELKN
jgi:hypothetical protein